MSIDVYDVDLGKQLGSFKTEAEALGRARVLLEEFGDAYAEDLQIGYDDGRPNLTGEDLMRRLATQDRRTASLAPTRPRSAAAKP